MNDGIYCQSKITYEQIKQPLTYRKYILSRNNLKELSDDFKSYSVAENWLENWLEKKFTVDVYMIITPPDEERQTKVVVDEGVFKTKEERLAWEYPNTAPCQFGCKGTMTRENGDNYYKYSYKCKKCQKILFGQINIPELVG